MDAEENNVRKARKSVAFTDEKLVVDADGSVKMISSDNDEANKESTALSHTSRSPSLSATLSTIADAAQAAVDSDDVAAAPLDGAADNGLLDLPKKKKKKAPKADETEGAAEDAGAEAGEDGGLDLTLKKKKKKKPTTKEEGFAAKLAALDLEGKEGEEAAAEEQAQEGDMEKGTGIWQHDETTPVQYDLLLNRFFSLLSQRNPDHASSGSRSYKIPPPQCMREGNKKTIFANLPEICKRMKRTEEHVTAFIFAELGTTGSVDGSRRLVIKGRFQQKQIENVLRKYILEYLSCKTCRSLDTALDKGENRLYFITCNSCGSRRSVAPIKQGFSAQVGKRKKMLK